MTSQIMRAILAPDAYNREYNQGFLVEARRLGDAEVKTPMPNKNIGFFAQSYDLNGEKIISYRGTDTELPQSLLDFFTDYEAFLTIFSPYRDGVNGFGIGRGSPHGAQATAAMEFHKAVLGKTGEDLGNQQNVTIVGLSLGGGLAGCVAAPYGQQTILFEITSGRCPTVRSSGSCWRWRRR